MDAMFDLALKLGNKLSVQKKTVTCAESCTAGGLSYVITSVPGSSAWFERGFVTYCNNAKIEMLGVAAELLLSVGAVSSEVAHSMAAGAALAAKSHYAIAITGVAGPDGGTPDKPVGTVWIAWSVLGQVSTRSYLFSGDRKSVREQSITAALVGLLDKI
jgi:nicotinamide-nucleotide amidase